MRILPVLSLAVAAVGLAACSSDSTTGSQIYRVSGNLNASGFATVTLPREVGTPNNLPALTCYTASQTDNVWFQVGSVELPEEYFAGIPAEDRVLDNCILEPSESDANRLNATIEGQPPNWRYSFTVVY